MSIASYDENHYSQVCKSLSADKHVIVEKPMCLKMSEMRDIENLLRKKKLKYSSNLVLRYNSKFNNIKNYINLKKTKYITLRLTICGEDPINFMAGGQRQKIILLY